MMEATNAKKPFALVRIVDDDEAVRDSYKFLLEGEGWIVRTYESAEDYLANDDRSIPGCGLFDVRMPGLSGLQLQQKLHDLADLLPIVFVSAHGDIEMAVHAIKNGACDFLPKPVDDDKLLKAIEKAVAVGLERLEESHRLKSSIESYRMLSIREKETADLIAKGLLNKQIADQLSISERTVQAHRANIFRKCGIKSAAQLAQILMRIGRFS